MRARTLGGEMELGGDHDTCGSQPPPPRIGLGPSGPTMMSPASGKDQPR
jgi:hypothetical protein